MAFPEFPPTLTLRSCGAETERSISSKTQPTTNLIRPGTNTAKLLFDIPDISANLWLYFDACFEAMNAPPNLYHNERIGDSGHASNSSQQFLAPFFCYGVKSFAVSVPGSIPLPTITPKTFGTGACPTKLIRPCSGWTSTLTSSRTGSITGAMGISLVYPLNKWVSLKSTKFKCTTKWPKLIFIFIRFNDRRFEMDSGDPPFPRWVTFGVGGRFYNIQVQRCPLAWYMLTAIIHVGRYSFLKTAFYQIG